MKKAIKDEVKITKFLQISFKNLLFFPKYVTTVTSVALIIPCNLLQDFLGLLVQFVNCYELDWLDNRNIKWLEIFLNWYIIKSHVLLPVTRFCSNLVIPNSSCMFFILVLKNGTLLSFIQCCTSIITLYYIQFFVHEIYVVIYLQPSAFP